MGVALYSYSYHLHFERWDFRQPSSDPRVSHQETSGTLRRPVMGGSVHPVVGLTGTERQRPRRERPCIPVLKRWVFARCR